MASKSLRAHSWRQQKKFVVSLLNMPGKMTLGGGIKLLHKVSTFPEISKLRRITSAQNAMQSMSFGKHRHKPAKRPQSLQILRGVTSFELQSRWSLKTRILFLRTVFSTMLVTFASQINRKFQHELNTTAKS